MNALTTLMSGGTLDRLSGDTRNCSLVRKEIVIVSWLTEVKFQQATSRKRK